MPAAPPELMLARSGPLPKDDSWSFELKWDGFRAVVSTEDGLCVRSRRGWDMTDLLPELGASRPGLLLDGELVAFDEDGLPSFPLLCERMLHRSSRPIPFAYMVFDVLSVDGESVMRHPFSVRRHLLDEYDVETPQCPVSRLHDDGELLFWAVCERGLEGVVAKRLSDPYKPGERGWVKTKNRGYWRFPIEVAAMASRLSPSSGSR
jgi:bifunctional non-homologous end joining protein LigD